MLLQDEYDKPGKECTQQILVTKEQSEYSFVFEKRCNFLQAAILSGDEQLVDQLLKLVRE